MKPEKAWVKAISNETSSGWSQDKRCPRGAFLGLCEEGLVKDVPRGNYTDSEKNKRYAVDAVYVLAERPEFVNNKLTLWYEVVDDKEKAHNEQMDVVNALWNADALEVPSLVSG